MKLLRKLFGRMTAEDYHREQVELITKAARRCAHDLAHAASYIEDAEVSKDISARAQMWRSTFYPAGDTKNYRHQLHHQIDERDRYIDKLEAMLVEAGIPFNHLNDPRMPF